MANFFYRHVLRLCQYTYRRVNHLNLGIHSAAIAFYGIFSTAPLLVLLVWLVGMALGGDVGAVKLEQMLHAIVGPDLATTIQSMSRSVAYSASGFWSSILAVITLIIGATTLLTQLKYSLNVIWGVSEPPVNTVYYFLWDRLRALLFVGSVSTLFLVSLLSESLLYALEQILVPLWGSENLLLIQLGSSAVNVILALVFFMAMFRILPDLEVRFRDLAVGALITAVLFMAGKAVVGWYLVTASLQPAYKAAGSFVVFLLWIYYNAQIVLVGAAFSREYTRLYGSEVRPRWEDTLNQDWF